MEKVKDANKVYMIGCAPSNAITGTNFNRYTFRTGRSVSQVTLAGSTYIDSHVGKRVAFFAPDYAGERDFIAAWKADQ
jgi:branched-chain amino acid transport system substrate-binding protein